MHNTLTKCLLLIFLCWHVAGCKTAEQRAAEAAAKEESLAAHDDTECQSYGAKPGTQPYIDCRLKQKEIRQSKENAATMAPPQPKTSVVCNKIGYTTMCY